MKNQAELKPLSKREIAMQAPLVLAKAPTSDVSDQYTFASTETVIDDLKKMGWVPTEVSQRAPRKGNTRFSPHMVKLINPDLKITKDVGGKKNISYPQIILQNRHDGLGSFVFLSGVFRVACLNGLVIATEKFGEVRIPHRGYSFEEMRKIVKDRTEAIQEQIAVMNTMQSRLLDKKERTKLAKESIILRSNTKAGSKEAKALIKKVGKETIEQLLTPIREEDEGEDLWSTFQVVQERLTKGLLHMPLGPKAKVRKVREITSFERDLEFNQDLFVTAKSFLAE